MGYVISEVFYKFDDFDKTLNPIILCSFPEQMKNFILSHNFETLNLNIELSRILTKYTHQERTKIAYYELMKIINKVSSPVYLEDYEILFDPRYSIDVIKVFIEISRRQKIIVKWCGTFQENSLIYSKPEFEDYKIYKIQDYNITCVM